MYYMSVYLVGINLIYKVVYTTFYNLLDPMIYRLTLLCKIMKSQEKQFKPQNDKTNKMSVHPAKTLQKRLRICSVISVNYHYITVLCPFNLSIRFRCYNTV